MQNAALEFSRRCFLDWWFLDVAWATVELYGTLVRSTRSTSYLPKVQLSGCAFCNAQLTAPRDGGWMDGCALCDKPAEAVNEHPFGPRGPPWPPLAIATKRKKKPTGRGSATATQRFPISTNCQIDGAPVLRFLAFGPSCCRGSFSRGSCVTVALSLSPSDSPFSTCLCHHPHPCATIAYLVATPR